MIEVHADFDMERLTRQFDRIVRQTEELRAALPVEFADWQSDDMNRKSPYTKTLDTVGRSGSNFTRASTVVLPTSRRRVKRRRRLMRRRKRLGIQHERVTLSQRPVLRQTLIERFRERFRNLLDRAYD